MQKLYKYMKFKYLEDTIKNRGVYAAKITELNDPYESYEIRYPDNYRICSFTTSYRKMLMWSFYGDNHKGCCVEFLADEKIKKIIKKVNYCNFFKNPKYSSEEEIKKFLIRKGKEWKYEDEYRAVYCETDKNNSDFWVKNEKIYLNLKISKIYFGNSFNFIENELNLKLVAEEIKKYNIENSENIEVIKLMVKDKSYRIVKDKQFNFESI